MALDLEEQEQVAELKAWWRQYGSLIFAAIVAAALTFAGWQAWRWYERRQASEAGVLYDTIGRAARAGDAKALRVARSADGGALLLRARRPEKRQGAAAMGDRPWPHRRAARPRPAAPGGGA